MEGKKLLSLGLKREFGNGDQIDILNDPWLLDEDANSFKMPRPARPLPHVPSPSLHQLKDHHSDEWNLQALSRFFDEAECTRILQIKPGGISAMNGFSWIHNSSGLYSVKSGYWVWRNSYLNSNLAPEQSPNYSAIFEQLWKTPASNKVKHLLWRGFCSSLSVGTELLKRRIKNDAECSLCGGIEDVNHLFFQCDLATEVWNLTPYASNQEMTFQNSSLASNFWACLQLSSSNTATHSEEHWPWLFWRIWKARNAFVFQLTTTSAQVIVARARADMNEWMEFHKPSTTAPPVQTSMAPTKWTAPEFHYLKCNVDAAWQSTSTTCGVAWILRDHTGLVRLHGTKVYPRLLSPLEAEATALVWAVNCMWNMGYDKVIFESDSQTLINAITSPQQSPRLATFLSEIQGIVGRRPWHVQFKHICREKNAAADSLANHSLSHPVYFGSIDCFITTYKSLKFQELDEHEHVLYFFYESMDVMYM